MFAETRFLKSPTGARLAYHHEPAAGTARGIVLVCHGLAEHSKRYRRFAAALSAAGYHAYAHDHRGHGETTAPDAPLGRFARQEGVTAVIEDVMAMRALAEERHPGLPLILFGHSMGGLISLNTAVTHPESFAGVAVWNSNFNVGLAGRAAQVVLAAEKMLLGSDVPSALLPKLTFQAWGKAIAGHRTLFDWLSNIPAEVDAYMADPLCGFDASVSLWQDIFALTFRAPQKRWITRLPRTMPFNLVGGGQDPATNGGKAIDWLANHLKKSGFSRITREIYQDARHETLNDIGAQVALRNFISWCGRITT
ncbi:alpha/beta fold hydrolase [Gellertiella hungarica]|uniref:Alpha-beta hydrolase superfamily lysophospholipase n=1 Tax=Gellertiella hungarica TaxID=1572859 RepID=A0A7W6J2F3_9HYPH|nr:alpha/beta hydrolase [Gellertiella hungarica]MBB4063523.1 alpha-beta hydrolase superfamily lysophospholipase [Gellertiella hungarica]